MKSVTVSEQESRKKNTIANLYRFSDLSVEAIAQQVDTNERDVRKIVDELIKDEALEVHVNLSNTNVGKIMTPMVTTIDSSERVREAAILMAEKHIPCLLHFGWNRDRPHFVGIQDFS